MEIAGYPKHSVLKEKRQRRPKPLITPTINSTELAILT